MNSKIFFLLIILIIPFCSAKLIEVGSADIVLDTIGATPKFSIGIEPAFSVYDLLGTTVSPAILSLNYSAIKIDKTVSLTHQIKPRIIVKDWNPSQYYFSIDSNLQNNGQYLEFWTLQPFLVSNKKLPAKIVWKQVLNHWDFKDTNSIVFDANHVFVGTKILFNSAGRDFSKEFSEGYSLARIVKNKEIVSAWFSTQQTKATDVISLGDLITKTKAICNAPDNNQIWISSNTYFVNADNNVDVVDCNLEIQAGTVVKFINITSSAARPPSIAVI